ncbi:MULTISPECIES: 8-oxoguanine DNA glycosylase OGG fold protein [Streptomyces]|uniref:8-oxoguanine DNA glycosylase OGG fold protein n=1 Tax=Streptomyces TaxID=1883 RepID=UPI0033E6552E
MRYDQSRADKLDEAMLELLLPESAVESLGQWLADSERGQRYANGSGPHAIPYVPSTWMAVAPWPTTFADRAAAASASVSRAEVVAAVRAAEQSESWAEAFVATQVWGYGVTGYGPYRTRQVLAQSGAEDVVTEAVSLLVDKGAVAAYEALSTLDGLGPAFLTKFLYFAGLALPEVKGPRPLILDSVLAGVLRRHAMKVGRAVGYEWSEAITKRIWRDSGWSSHRYDVYLRWMYAANDRLVAASINWPAAPDVLELALFSAAWNPE